MSVGAVNKQTGERIPTAGMPAIDSVLSGTSTNPVQNRVVKAALDEKVDAVSGKGLSTNDYSNTDKAKVAASLNVFTGTQAAWAQLSTAEKKTYQRADFTDDYDNTAIGDLTALHTSAKSSIVNAINEVADGKQNSTDNNLQTTAKTIVGGINEVKSGLTGVTANDIGPTGYDDISATTSETAYVCPCDGYLYASSETDTTGAIRVVVLGAASLTPIGYIYMNVSDEYQIQTLLLRKGMKVFVSNRTANTVVRFNKLTS